MATKLILTEQEVNEQLDKIERELVKLESRAALCHNLSVVHRLIRELQDNIKTLRRLRQSL